MEQLFLTVGEVLEHFKIINTTKVDLSEGIRQETPLFEYEAFREAWINACLHNSWGEKIPPSIYVFDDRIEIVSYGGQASLQESAGELHLSLAGVKKIALKLQSLGILERIGANKDGYWLAK